MKLYLGADHRGFQLKESLKPWLVSQGHTVEDCGNSVFDPDDDFPDFAFSVADSVVKDEGSRGIIICGSGAGMTIAANKVAGVRAIPGFIPDDVIFNRKHDDVNVLALSADYSSFEEVQQLIGAFLTTPFSGDERHVRRIQKIESREAR